MSNHALSASCQRIGTRSIILPFLYPILTQTRNVSLNSAIGRGLRKSQSVGFRGRERPIRSAQPADVRIRAGKRVVKDDSVPVKRSRAARFNDPDSSFGKRSAVGQEKKEKAAAKREYTRPRINYEKSEKIKRAAESDRMAFEKNPTKNKMSASRLAYLARNAVAEGRTEEKIDTRARYDPEGEAFAARKQREREPEDRFSSRQEKPSFRKYDSGNPEARFSNNRDDRQSNNRDDRPFYNREERQPYNREDRPTFNKEPQAPVYPNRFTPQVEKIDKRIPLSIPYTTPASEFLYGTSVIEAALTSKANPKRKLYKLYIYSGENRGSDSDSANRDKEFARLARRQGVPVEFVKGDWLRMMDKMSAGRPHNGYILEASPLPRLPLVSLGQITEVNGKAGFEINVDHQSKEEAAVNGSSSFIPCPSMQLSHDGRRPFILLLDSILDPGNLGGIIRTASFLGVTGIAISARNSAGFTPVVLKASAGASENVTLFTIKSPAQFVEDSKRNGWKVYAAVAPNSNHAPGGPEKLSTDQLYNPLHDAPSILMLGNEGEGLRWNLRSKADVEVSIEGSKARGGVDSLNVSVATGILCTAFLRQLPLKKPLVDALKESREKKARIMEKKKELF